jgi:ATP-binding cassette subfamily F protein 3
VLLSVANLRKGFGAEQILTGVSFRLDRREKVALVGRNGTGKTTLLRILTGAEEPDGGSVQLAKGAEIGYLRQEKPVDAGRTVLEEAEVARRHALELREKLQALESKMAAGQADHADLEQYAILHEHFIDVEGYSAERDIRTILTRMGFDEAELDKPASKLSGGETTRLALARLILEEPDLLILDEPTNHLDLQATEWLEGWLRSYPGAVLLVSHDRAFLESFGDRFLELRDGKVFSYPGPFAQYQRLKAEESARLAEVAKRQQQQIDKMDEYVRRFMGSERTAQARGRLKLMNRLIASRAVAPRSEKGMAASLQAQKRSGDIVAEAKGLDIGFPGVTLIRGLDWTVRRGERWGVIGENGAGKSSLIRTLLGAQPALGGSARLGSNVEAGYFAQDAGQFDPDDSPLDVIVDVCGFKPPEARDLLGRYLFSGEDVFRPVKTFSGGEKNKLALAVLTGLNPNLLVLDEPTNHLDMDSRQALADVLKSYGGTLILVSHDRWLLSTVTNRTLDVRRDGVRQFGGSYEEYRRPVRKAPPHAPRVQETASREAAAGLSPREVSKEIQRLAKQIMDHETEIAVLESDLKGIEAALAAPKPGDDIVALTRRHGDVQTSLERCLAAWEAEGLKLEELKGLQG